MWPIVLECPLLPHISPWRHDVANQKDWQVSKTSISSIWPCNTKQLANATFGSGPGLKFGLLPDVSDYRCASRSKRPCLQGPKYIKVAHLIILDSPLLPEAATATGPHLILITIANGHSKYRKLSHIVCDILPIMCYKQFECQIHLHWYFPLLSLPHSETAERLG